MSHRLATFALAGTLFLAGCAAHHGYCLSEPYFIELSPSNRHADGLQLIRLSKIGWTTFRLPTGELAKARPGQVLTLRDGSEAPGGYRLRSVDRSTGRVVVEGTRFPMYSRWKPPTST